MHVNIVIFRNLFLEITPLKVILKKNFIISLVFAKYVVFLMKTQNFYVGLTTYELSYAVKKC